MSSEAYTTWVYRLWDRLGERSGHRVHYMAHDRVACYCPSCRLGTLSLRFVDADPPRAVISSGGVVGSCSEGCTEAEIVQALG